MKKLLISAAATALLLGTAVAAPDDNDHHRGHHGAAASSDNVARGDNAGNADRMNGRAAERNAEIRSNAMNSSATSNARATARSNRIDASDRTSTRAAEQSRARYQEDMRNGTVTHADRARDFNRIVNGNANDRSANDNNRNSAMNRSINDRHRSNFDVTQYRRNVRADRHYRIGAYRAPHGYSYRRWSYGERLPSMYYAHNYWLTDFLTFGLLTPPDGYVWVRYGDDALLIDEYSGEIIQVQYGVFI